MPAKRDAKIRFWEKVNKDGPSGCWVWTASLNRGYGELGIMTNGKPRNYKAHRLAWEWLRGPIPEGLVVDHLCRNRACVNPDHLELVTNEENIRRGMWQPVVNVTKTECIHGHELAGDNVYRPPSRPNVRQCKTCMEIRGASRRTGSRSQERSHCSQGHELAGDNLYRAPSQPNKRVCRACRTARARERWAAGRAQTGDAA